MSGHDADRSGGGPGAPLSRPALAERFTTVTPVTLQLSLGMGSVRITASDRMDTVVEVRPSDGGKRDDVDAAEQTVVDQSGDEIVVKVPKTRWRNSWFSDGGSVDVRVELPIGSRLEGKADLGSLSATGRLGACRFRTGMGDIAVGPVGSAHLHSGFGHVLCHSVAGDLDVHTGTGEVRVGPIDGTALVRNSNGPTSLGRVRGSLRVKSANGPIVVDGAANDVSLKTANGNVRLGEVVRGVVTLDSGAGDLEIGIAAGTAAWLDLHTHFGNVDNDLDAADQPSEDGPTATVRARTAAGDISIRRAGAPATPPVDAG